MSPADIDVTLSRWLASTWFRHTARLMMIVGTFIAGYAGVTVANIRSDVAALQQDQDAVKAQLALRTLDQERFQSNIDKDLTFLRSAIMLIDTDVSAIKVDAATVRGILQEMQRRDKALIGPSKAQISVRER